MERVGGISRSLSDPLLSHLGSKYTLILNAYNMVSGSESVGYFFIAWNGLHKLNPGRSSPFLNVYVVRKRVGVKIYRRE